MLKHSANLGFLWQQHDLLDGIRAAAQAGFDAVECHWPFDYSATDVSEVLNETGLAMIGLNTYPGDRSKGDFGVCAHPERISEAQQVIDQALEYAVQIETPKVHVMAGKIANNIDQKVAMQTFENNLVYAANKAAKHGITILIEPINRKDVADYFVGDMQVAVDIVNNLNLPNLKIMFDCFHIQKTHGELKKYLELYLDLIGHIQIASYPDRHEPDEGVIDYADLFRFLQQTTYSGYIGAEYNPRTTTDEGIAWLQQLNQ